MINLLVITPILLLGLIVVFVLVEYSLHVADRVRRLAQAIGLDLLQLYSASSMARLDVTERQNLIELAQQTAAAELTHQLQLNRLNADKLLIELGGQAHQLRLATGQVDKNKSKQKIA